MPEHLERLRETRRPRQAIGPDTLQIALPENHLYGTRVFQAQRVARKGHH
jgi:hypothetical protein